MKMTKKKVLVLALAVCLFAVVSMGTLAWFNDSASITNTFKVATSETDTDPTFSVEVFETDPTTNSETTTGVTYYDVLPGDSISKNPTVRNTGDYSQWIRVTVTLKEAAAWKAGGGSLKFTDLFTGSTYGLAENAGSTNETWLLVANNATVSQADDTATWYIYLNEALTAGTSKVLFTNVSVPGSFDMSDMAALSDDFEITVSADALQADNTGANAVAAFANVGWANGADYAG